MTAMRILLKKLLNDENGAVTVDWVVLTAAIVGLGFAVLVPIANSTGDTAQVTADFISKVKVGFGD